jgi:hypothetical protein
VCVEAAGAREYVLVERAGGGARPPLDRAGEGRGERWLGFVFLFLLSWIWLFL